MALKRISMAGSDIAVTDAAVADLVLEYAMHLGRAGTTDVVTVPVPDHGREVHVDLLLGPSSQIVLSDSEEETAEQLPRVDEVAAELRSRIERVTGRSAAAIEGDQEIDPMEAFTDFGEYGEDPHRA